VEKGVTKGSEEEETVGLSWTGGLEGQWSQAARAKDCY